MYLARLQDLPTRLSLRKEACRCVIEFALCSSTHIRYILVLTEKDGFCIQCVIQVLSKQDAETLALCKNMMDRGECPPLMVVFDPYEGYFNPSLFTH